MTTATLVRADLPDYRGVANLYRLSEPINGADYVVASSIPNPFDTGVPETMIFPAHENGIVMDYGELGAVVGHMSDRDALADAGITLC